MQRDVDYTLTSGTDFVTMITATDGDTVIVYNSTPEYPN